MKNSALLFYISTKQRLFIISVRLWGCNIDLLSCSQWAKWHTCLFQLQTTNSSMVRPNFVVWW